MPIFAHALEEEAGNCCDQAAGREPPRAIQPGFRRVVPFWAPRLSSLGLNTVACVCGRWVFRRKLLFCTPVFATLGLNTARSWGGIRDCEGKWQQRGGFGPFGSDSLMREGTLRHFGSELRVRGGGQKKGPGERPVERGRRREVGEKEEQEKTEAKLSPVRAPLVELPAFAGFLG